MSEENQTLEKLKNLECPFTWGLDEINGDEINQIVKDYEESRTRELRGNDELESILYFMRLGDDEVKKTFKEHEEWRTREDENLVPILKFMRLVVTVYENALKEDFTESDGNLKLAKIQLETMKNDKDYKNISLEVLENIYNGTNCHLEAKLKNFEKVEEILKLIKEMDYRTNPKARSTLHGCKSLAFSKYNASCKRETGKAIDFAKLAIKDNSEFAEWYFILGKHFRSQRRRPQLYFRPCQEEIEAFETAYKLCPKALYGLYIAEILDDQTNYWYSAPTKSFDLNKKIFDMNKKIFDTKPENSGINLRLALGFLKSRDFKLAKKCLIFVKQRSPEDPMYKHCLKLYSEACERIEIARAYQEGSMVFAGKA